MRHAGRTKKGYGRLTVTLRIIKESSLRNGDFQVDAPSFMNSSLEAGTLFAFIAI
jgi:hypothetical protein